MLPSMTMLQTLNEYMVFVFLICGLGVLATALVGSDTQVRTIFLIEKKAKFTNMKALVFLVIANGIATGYSLIHGRYMDGCCYLLLDELRLVLEMELNMYWSCTFKNTILVAGYMHLCGWVQGGFCIGALGHECYCIRLCFYRLLM